MGFEFLRANDRDLLVAARLPARLRPASVAVLLCNPFGDLLTVARAPLLGEAVAPVTYIGLSIMAVVGWIATFAAFANIRRRIVHYL